MLYEVITIAGIRPLEPGYKRFRIAPLLGGGITFAEAGVSEAEEKAN